MSKMAAAPPPSAPRLDTVLSFNDADAPAASPAVAESESATPTRAFSDAGSVSGDSDAEDAEFEFEFAFAPPLSPGASLKLAPADDLFAHGRIVAAYPLFDRHILDDEAVSAASSPDNRPPQQQASSTAPPSPDAYCACVPRSAPGSPSREAPTPAAAFPKSSSTGESRRFWRLRDLVAGGGGGRSHSDGKEKFVFLQCRDGKDQKHAAAANAKDAAALQKQGKKKKGSTGNGKAAGATEMDMATAHRLFYGKPGSAALAGDRPRQHQQSYLPHRAFFASANVLGRSHHPY